MVPVLLRSRMKKISISIVTILTHGVTALVAAVLEQFVPGIAVKVAFEAVVVLCRVAEVCIACAESAEGANAALTPAV